MKARLGWTALCVLLCLWGCREVVQGLSDGFGQQGEEPKPKISVEPLQKEPLPDDIEPVLVPLEQLPDTVFVRLADYSKGFSYDLKYASEDNFLGQAVYDCGECYLRANTARALIRANEELAAMGLHLYLFDCYRPQRVQYRMWEIMPDAHYVARPEKGSIHNRGGAVDLTLAGPDGVPLDMGTPFDHFGEEAHHAYEGLAPEVLENRRLLRSMMERHGFWTIRTEWWHYNLSAASLYPNADFTWPCP